MLRKAGRVMITNQKKQTVDDIQLLEMARDARENAYAPYSHFQVGAAVQFDSGNVYCGCNVENASYGGTVCAERVAILEGVAAGEVKQGSYIAKVAIVGGLAAETAVAEALDFCLPCGFCLQVMAEFANPQTEKKEGIQVLVAKLIAGEVKEYKMFAFASLLPHSFML